ncbi:MAG: Gfo/Idh/MocA family oxidoreductase [Candidatus Omnitrophota bacterium]
MKNIAVIGAGYWGKNLVRVFSRLGVLHTICDENPAVLKNVLASCDFSGSKKPRPTTFFEEVLADSEIDAVVIATPAVSHYEITRSVLSHSKDVFVEKPLALKVEEGKELVRIAEEKSLILMVGHILNYHPAVLKLKELIDAGSLGQIYYLYSNRLNFGKIRSEENILWSFAPHDISVILMLLEEEPIKVTATGAIYLQPGVTDITLSHFVFKNDVQAHIFVSWLHPYKEQKLVVIGQEKMAVFDDATPEKLVLYPHKVSWKDRVPTAQKAEPEVVLLKMEEPLLAEARHFLECLNNRNQPRTDGKEGLRVLKILDRCQRSLSNPSAGCHSESSEESLPYFVHPSSYVDDGVEIGEGTKIWHFCHILGGSRIGKDCKIGQNVVLGPNVTVGNNVKIQNNVSVYEGVILEDDVFCGPSMVFTNVFNPRSAVPRRHELRQTVVKKGATIGANATVVCGYTIGRYAFVGAGAVVTRDIPDYALVTGVPAKITGWMCECGVKLNFAGKKGTCPACKKKYLKNSPSSLEPGTTKSLSYPPRIVSGYPHQK